MSDRRKILVTGGTGMVGKAFEAQHNLNPLGEVVFTNSSVDLRDKEQTKKLFEQHKPTDVVHLAAKVGGVKSNKDYIADFYRDNIAMQTNVLECAKDRNAKVVSLLSTCIYPDALYVSYPLTENQLHLGPPHDSNYGYAYAKRMLEVQTRAYNEQYGTRFYCAIPNNIFGTHDNFHLTDGHVVPVVIRKIYESIGVTRTPPTFWGNGTPLREFTFAEDVARALLFMLEYDDIPGIMNIGNTKEISIDSLIKSVIDIFGCPYSPIWDKSFPMGQHRKPSSNELFVKVYKEKTGEEFEYQPFMKSLKVVCEWFEKNYPNVRGV